jgi:hypothetical protein
MSEKKKKKKKREGSSLRFNKPGQRQPLFKAMRLEENSNNTH